MSTATEDKRVKLHELPVTVNVSALAAGILDLFTEDERVILRFGMLPAKKMEILEKQLRDKFEGLGQHPTKVWPLSMISESYGPDDRLSMVGGAVGGAVREWNIRKLVSEALHEVTLGIYAIGDLVV